MSKGYYRMMGLGDDRSYSAHVEIDDGVVVIGAGCNYREREYHCYTLTPAEAREVYKALKDYFEKE